jgi:hypothetical protein
VNDVLVVVVAQTAGQFLVVHLQSYNDYQLYLEFRSI